MEPKPAVLFAGIAFINPLFRSVHRCPSPMNKTKWTLRFAGVCEYSDSQDTLCDRLAADRCRLIYQVDDGVILDTEEAHVDEYHLYQCDTGKFAVSLVITAFEPIASVCLPA